MTLDRLLQGEIARDVLRAYRRDLTVRARNRQQIPEHAEDVLAALEEAGQRRHGDMSASGPGLVMLAASPSGHGGGSVTEAAELVGISARHARRLAATGQVRCLRVGGRRLIDLDSLQDVIASRRSRTA